MEYKAFFSFYDTTVSIEADNQEIIDASIHDFSFFSCPVAGKEADIKIYQYNRTLPYSDLPPMTSVSATPRNISYKDSGKVYIDYFGKAINVSDIKKNTFHIYAGNKDLAREIVYLTVLSRVCEKLEKKGMHRIHALGAESNGNGALILLPCGGGKTSLTLELFALQNKSIKIISEDSPLIKGKMILPFPLRIGVRLDSFSCDIPERFIRRFKRIEYDDKVTIDMEYFSQAICENPVEVKAIIVGVRSTAENTEIKPISKIGVLKYCFMNSVVGVGLYQGMEFIMNKNLRELFPFLVALCSRAITNVKIILKAKTFLCVLGTDKPKNAETISNFLTTLK